MKNFLLAALCVSGSVFAQHKVDFTAKIENSTSDTLRVMGRGFEKVILGKNGEFKSSFEVANPSLYMWKNGDASYNFFLADAFSLALTADANSLDQTIKYQGNGSEENNLITRFSVALDGAFSVLSTATDEEFSQKVKALEPFADEAMYAKLNPEFAKMMPRIASQQTQMLSMMFEQEKMVKELVGKPSIAFNFRNIDGGQTSSESLKGKYVYIDAWATWCGPCIQEIPSMKKIEKQYHGKNITFVSLSLDKEKDFQKWQKMVADKQMGGVQLFGDKDFESEFAQFYGINSIPRFILIDPKGNIVDANAPRPSDPELVTLLDQLVK